MTSPTEPPKESLKDRISHRMSTDSKGRLIDADARHTRNVSWMFYAIIVVIVLVIVAGLAYGYWESNLKPVASVQGQDVSRSDWEDRLALEEFRIDRAQTAVSNALAEGTISSDLANLRFGLLTEAMPEADTEVAVELVDLIYKSQLAADEGVELTEAELEEALAADGGFDAARLIDAVILITAEQEVGELATDAGIADAHSRALEVIAELEAGAEYETLADTYGPGTSDSAWITQESLAGVVSAGFAQAVFEAEIDGVTDVFEAPTGEQFIAIVREAVEAEADPGFIEAVNDEVGEDVHRRNVELEALAAKLETQVINEAVEGDFPQVRLAEIFTERGSTYGDDAAGEVRASHILYQPETPLDEDGNATDLADLPADDPAWDAAQAEAEKAAAELSVVEDVSTRTEAFAIRAASESDGPSSVNGGDLGWFQEGGMVAEFDEAIWGGIDLQQGDILGPVRTEFGWHVILFDQFRSSLDVRLAEAQDALAADGADFAAVAAEYSDREPVAEPAWQLVQDLEDDLVVGLSVIEPGQWTEPIDGFDGMYIYQKLEEVERPLEPTAAAEMAEYAFSDWYDELYYTAQDEGDISIDDGIYE